MNSPKLSLRRSLGFQQLEDRRLMAADLMAAVATTAKAATVVAAPVQTAPIQTPIEIGPIQLPPTSPTPAPAPAAAAQVSAFLAGGLLTINGDNGNDNVTITQPSHNEFVLTSTNGTLFNGVNTKLDFVNVTGNVNVTFKGTSEGLSIGTGNLVAFPANLNVNMGNGTNSFSMYDATVKGSMTLNGGSGHDYAYISESTIGSSTVNGGANDLTISLGGGNNGLVLENNVTVERDLNILDPSSASDTIFMAEGITAGRYVYINTGNGNDQLTLAGVTAGSQLNIQTAGGNDTVYLGGQGLGDIDPVVADSIYVDLGAGNDALKIGGDDKGEIGGGVYAKHSSTFNGGAGTDNIWNESYNSLSGLSGFETSIKF